MKHITRRFIKYACIVLVFCMAANLFPQRKPMMMNMEKLAFYYSQRLNEYWVAAFAIDAAYQCGPFDTNEIQVLLEKTNGDKIPVDKNELKIVCLGTMYNEALARDAVLFRFNIVIDNSGSIDDRSMKFILDTLTWFYKNIPLVFESQIIKFSDDIQLKSPFLKDKDALVNHVNTAKHRGNTALFKAITVGVDELINSQSEVPLQFTIVITDGRDNRSRISPEDFKQQIVNKCRNNHIPLFIVGVTDHVDGPLLEEIADFGIYYHIKEYKYLNKAFNMFLNVIKDTYIIKTPATVPFNDLTAIHLVKEPRPGKFDTIQDFIIRR